MGNGWKGACRQCRSRVRAWTVRCALAFGGPIMLAGCGGDAGERVSPAVRDTTAASPQDVREDTVATPAQIAPTQDTAGAAVLDRAARAYEDVRSLQADFVMALENPLLRRTTTSAGTLYQRMPDRILLRFSDPDGDVIVGDGRYFWVYYPSINPEQVTRAPAAQAGSGGVDLRAQFVGDPRARFTWTVDGREEADGRPATVMTLVPLESAGYRSLKAWIDDGDALVRRFEIAEHNGATRAFRLSSLRVNPTLADSLFVFEPPPGVVVVGAPGGN
jgi:outer membrane lipoprotein carrier protein